MSRCYDLLVVGAGPHGLAVAWAAQRRGMGVVILDRNAVVGGAWPRMWPELRCLSRRQHDVDGDGVAPAAAGDYATAAAVAQQWQAFADRHALPVHLGTEVTGVAAQAQRWAVATPEQTWHARQVVLATGEMAAPRWDQLAAGTLPVGVVHVADLQQHQFVRGQRLIVVGAGNSAAQVVAAACDLAARIDLCAQSLPSRWRSRVRLPRSLTARLLHSNWLAPLLRRACQRQVPLQGHDLQTAVAAGKVKLQPRATGVCEHGVVLGDGRRLVADLVVLCTGFRRDLAFATGSGCLDETGWPLHHRGVSTRVPGLAFAGLPCARSPQSGFLRGAVGDAVALVDALVGAQP